MFRGISGISGIPENEDRQEPDFKSECTTKLLLKDNKSTNNSTKLTDEEKKKKSDKKQKKYNDVPICKNCGKKHPTKAEDECWELEKNKDSRLSNWKSAKST